VRDEIALLGQLASCLGRQTVEPLVWQIVDTGSTDGTPEEAERWAASKPWIRLSRLPAAARARGGQIATAIQVGIAERRRRRRRGRQLRAAVLRAAPRRVRT
jgi:glycosyltransferase involved in cell wall biosynthesis